MAKETEHKYLVTNDSYIEMASHSYMIQQGYLSRDPNRTVRVRVRDNQGFLTVKGITIGDTRQEYEYEISLDDAQNILRLCQPPILCKRRYIVPYEGLIWEVDRFEGELSPLVIAEVELAESRHDYLLPPFVGTEVTNDSRYFNSNLLPPVKSDQ